ncbi:MAG: NrdH-redoxin [Deltaproteobacteria bacterium]|nr:NrdH-redoxin [Deltaproteobacteria bacterium]
MKKLVLYGQPGCGHFKAAVAFLRQSGVDFEERNIQTDPEALEELVNRWKRRASVTLVIDDKAVIEWSMDRGHSLEERLKSLV